MYDKKVNIGDAYIHHGKANDRVYLMKLGNEDPNEIMDKIEQLAEENDYTKIQVKIPEDAASPFLERDYIQEAKVPGFYNGETTGLFLSKFIDEERAKEKKPQRVKEVIEASLAKKTGSFTPELDDGYMWKVAEEADAQHLTEVYKVVFETYPFPIHDPDYIIETMRENIVYFCAMKDDKIIAVSSSEMDRNASNVEMTDFATIPDHRGHGIAVFLLKKMEEEMRKLGIKTAYTIARSYSFGMNITFAKLNYSFAGTLVSNTNISGGMESMNIWYKPL